MDIWNFRNDLVVIEWKTSQRTKATLEDAYDDPVQIAAYVGALNADDKYPFEVLHTKIFTFQYMDLDRLIPYHLLG